MTILRLIVYFLFLGLPTEPQCISMKSDAANHLFNMQLANKHKNKKKFNSCRFVSLQGTARAQEWIPARRHPKRECV